MARPAYGGSPGARESQHLPSDHAAPARLELLPDDAGRDAVLADWQALRDAGLRSQLDHRG